VVTTQRGLLEARILLSDDTPMTVYVTHLEPKDEAVRMQQLQSLLSWTVRDRGKPHILMGDLNTYNPADFPSDETLTAFRTRAEARGFTFFRAQVIPKLLKSGYVDACEGNPQPTWDTEDGLWARLDFILLSEPLAPRLISCQTIQSPLTRSASDHLPVMAMLSSR
jgi:endonuclease/exonuclease/phosphatase family metal-dependent hydrolase